MAPTKPSNRSSSKSSKSGKPGKSSGATKKNIKAAGSAPIGISKRKAKSMALAKPGGAQKTKSKPTDGKKKKRVYTEAELDIPKLNGIIPAGIAKPKGQKKGKIFVDDAESMMAIMSVVHAEKEGQVESKIMKARQWEEVREAKKREMEKRSQEKKDKFEERKEGLKKKSKAKDPEGDAAGKEERREKKEWRERDKKPKKRVSFG